jgi:hypothetical protein
MIIALLFNSDDPKYRGYYLPPVLQTVFANGVLQNSGRHMKVSVGDVLIFSHSKSWAKYDALTEATYFHYEWALLHEDRLRATFRAATVYSLVFENMSKQIAMELDKALMPDDAYLGLLAVDFAYGPHLGLFRNLMVSKYRVMGRFCRIFYTMGEVDGRDEYEIEQFRALGFDDVDWEDSGARRTILDNFDTLKHFQEVKAFRHAITSFLKGGEDAAYELVMILEDLNPRLFNALGSAVARLASAKNEEHVAQAAISGRRYLEKLADVLFAARKFEYKGRKVGQEQFRNRLWAYIADHARTPDAIKMLGNEVDRLNKEFSAGVHRDKEKDRIMRALVDTSELTATLLALNPEEARKPYFAYSQQIRDFFLPSAPKSSSLRSWPLRPTAAYRHIGSKLTKRPNRRHHTYRLVYRRSN